MRVGYYENSDFCRAASSDVPDIDEFAPSRRSIRHRRAWAIGRAVSRAADVDGSSSASCTRQISLLIAFELLTRPTFGRCPISNHRIAISSRSLYHVTSAPRLAASIPRADRSGRRDRRRAVKGSDITRSLPDRLGRDHRSGGARFTYVTDWSFVSGCSPPFLTETQLPLSTTGR